MSNIPNVSVIVPARNEQRGLESTLAKLTQLYPDWEVIVVDDASTDDTAGVAMRHGARVVRHPYRMGNGAAIKAGARKARGKVLITMDGDGQHKPEDIERLLRKLEEGYEMVVGSRSAQSQASLSRWFGNSAYNRFASLIVGSRIEDLTSGFRVVNTHRFREFLHLFPNGFSYPTTVTMAFFRSGYPVAYVPIVAEKRIGKSHIKLLKDGLRFLIIVFKVGTLYSPLKVFIPFSAMVFLAGLSNYLYTYLTMNRFTNMSAFLFISSVLIFLIGLVSEQITMLLYKMGRRLED